MEDAVDSFIITLGEDDSDNSSDNDEHSVTSDDEPLLIHCNKLSNEALRALHLFSKGISKLINSKYSHQ